MALLGLTFPRGRNGNLAMGLFGAMAPVGAAGASLFAAFLVQLAEWKWVFFFPTILAFVVFSLALIPLPWDPSSRLQAYLDWVGSYLGVVGLIVLKFPFNQVPGKVISEDDDGSLTGRARQAPVVGWLEAYTYTLLIVSIVHLAFFVLWKAEVARHAILPSDVWTSPPFGLMQVLIIFYFMSMGIFLWYIMFLGINIRGYSIIEMGAKSQSLLFSLRG